MTDPLASARKGPPISRPERWTLLAILLFALAARLHGLAFGLPALYDPDEPLFVTTALDMLRGPTLDPHWFGHPGTITLYCIALISLGVGLIGIFTGRFANVHDFVAAVYADPGVIFLPSRFFLALCGVASVWLIWSIGRRAFGPRQGLIAAALLAASPVHIATSQLIRTDVQASLFMLLCARAALDMAQDEGRRAGLRAGIWAGLACATKWPAALILINPMSVAMLREGGLGTRLGRVALIGGTAVATLLIASPFLLVDHAELLRNLIGEARPVHPGATGQGALANLLWYLAGPMRAALGSAALLLALVGIASAARRPPIAAALYPVVVLLGLVIIVQHLRWERWVVPLLPFVALASAHGLCWLLDRAGYLSGLRRKAVEVAATLLLLVPLLPAIQERETERTHDTRQIASAWVRAHVPPGSTILVEHGAFDLFRGPWHFLFPLGTAGCVDIHRALGGQITYGKVETARAGRPVLDLGNVSDERLASCAADYAVLTHVDRYRADPRHFATALARYEVLLSDSRTVMVIRPEKGRTGGPIVRIIRLRGIPTPPNQ